MVVRGVSFFLTVVAFSIYGIAQEQPIPKPVSPPLPIPGHEPGAAHAPEPAPGNMPVLGDEAVAPYIDNQTLAVARFDLKGIDFPALQSWTEQAAELLRKNNKEIFRARIDIRQQIDEYFHWVSKFRDVGVERLYVVVDLDDLRNDYPPYLVIPLSNGADGKGIEAMLNEATGATTRPGEYDSFASIVRGAVIFAAPSTMQRLTALQPLPRPELATAFSAVGTGQIHFALVPQEGARKLLEQSLTNLPEELGGGPITPVSRGIKWGAAAVELPPSPAMRLIVQAANPQDAQELKQLADRAIAWAAQRKEGPSEALVFAQFVAQLKPKLAGDRLSVTLDREQTQALAGVFAARMLGARVDAMRTAVMGDMLSIANAIYQYARDHEMRLPKDLRQSINQYLGDKALKVWVDPLRPNQKKPYVYVRLADNFRPIQRPREAILLYENHTTWDDGINVLFADGHVEWISDEKQFKQMLDQTKKLNPNAAEMPQ